MKKKARCYTYRWWWSRMGGRKWTHIMRDFAYQNPMLVLFIGFGLGMWLDAYVSILDIWKVFAGLLLAHLFWGTKWKKGQGIGGYDVNN